MHSPLCLVALDMIDPIPFKHLPEFTLVALLLFILQTPADLFPF